MECNRCGCKRIGLSIDSRGLAEARCAECGAFIKKMKTQEVADFYEAKLAELAGSEATLIRTEVGRKKRVCKYCTENYAIVRGSMREARQIIPVTAKFCPLCGRELEASDRAY